MILKYFEYDYESEEEYEHDHDHDDDDDDDDGDDDDDDDDDDDEPSPGRIPSVFWVQQFSFCWWFKSSPSVCDVGYIPIAATRRLQNVIQELD